MKNDRIGRKTDCTCNESIVLGVEYAMANLKIAETKEAFWPNRTPPAFCTGG